MMFLFRDEAKKNALKIMSFRLKNPQNTQLHPRRHSVTDYPNSSHGKYYSVIQESTPLFPWSSERDDDAFIFVTHTSAIPSSFFRSAGPRLGRRTRLQKKTPIKNHTHYCFPRSIRKRHSLEFPVSIFTNALGIALNYHKSCPFPAHTT